MNTAADVSVAHDRSVPGSAVPSAPRRCTLPDLLNAFLTHIVQYRDYSPATARAYERDCERLIRFLDANGGPTDPGAIRGRDVRLFLASLSDLSAATVRRTLYGV